MTKYYRITEKELIALKNVSDTTVAMMNFDEDFNKEAMKGQKAIDSILKRAGLKRNENEYKQECPSIPNAY